MSGVRQRLHARRRRWRGFASIRAGSPSSIAISTGSIGGQGHRDGHRHVARGPRAAALRLLDANTWRRRRPHPPDGDARRSLDAYQDPRDVISPPTIVIIPEWKAPVPETVTRMAEAVHGPCPPRLSRVQDPKLNSHTNRTASPPASRPRRRARTRR